MGDELRWISLVSSGDPIIHMWIMAGCVCCIPREWWLYVRWMRFLSLSRSPSFSKFPSVSEGVNAPLWAA